MEKTVIKIGDYYIVEYETGHILMEAPSGERMELTPEIVDAFFKEHFYYVT